MNSDTDVSLWVQLFLAQKYMNEFLKGFLPKNLKINAYDYFVLLILRNYHNLTFYEINKALPIDGKSLHNKINSLIEKELLEREFLETGSSFINLKEETRDLVEELRKKNKQIANNYWKANEVKKLSKNLFEFNEKMRHLLGFKIKEETLNKVKSSCLQAAFFVLVSLISEGFPNLV